MRCFHIYATGRQLIFGGLLFFLGATISFPARAAGVTIITHGYDGDITGWITAMADEIPTYFHSSYAGLNQNFTIYTVTLTTNDNNYYYQWSRDSGSPPFTTETGEIIIKLDWSQMAGSPNPFSTAFDVSTYDVAAVASYVFLQTNTITDLNGHALVEYPVHLIGHSRGGSLMSQISYILGTNGVWVDQLTTLDPHPLNNDGNDDFPIFTEDAPVHTYANVLFHDNYWQDVGLILDPHGEPVSGAYVRQLDVNELSEGYNEILSDLSPEHSNVHLWYYSTIDLSVPTSYNDDGDTVTIDSTMRGNWWTDYEREGANAGFEYSLIGGATV